MKKRVLAIFIAVFFIASTFSVYAVDNVNTEERMSGAWIATVKNLDYPKTKTEQGQKEEFIQILNALKDKGINTVFMQVRPNADALYESDINPWSAVLTGRQGSRPTYDPMKFMIEETHKRGMEFHAWLNPYRITSSGTDLGALDSNHPARLHPEWVIEWNDALYYNPANQEVKNHIRDTVYEIITGYDVDGIHFDDYFYPGDYPLADGEDKDGEEAQARRTHVNDLIYMVNKVIKDNKSEVEFGVSPAGICVNEETGKYGIAIKGSQSYYKSYCDPRVWIANGWVDYIAPQIYWETTHKTAAFEPVVKWWVDQVKGTDVKLYIGHAVYKDAVAKEITNQLQILEKYDSYVKGSIFFRADFITDNYLGCGDAIKEYGERDTSTTEPVPHENPGSISPENPDVIEFNPEAIYSSAKVKIDGTQIGFEAYNIGGYNYFKLRDIAKALNNTDVQFDTVWMADYGIINIAKGVPYVSMGGELSGGNGKNKKAVLSSAKLSIAGQEIAPLAYNIEGNNFFKLRDLGDCIGFDVAWDAKAETIIIDTKK